MKRCPVCNKPSICHSRADSINCSKKSRFGHMRCTVCDGEFDRHTNVEIITCASIIDDRMSIFDHISDDLVRLVENKAVKRLLT